MYNKGQSAFQQKTKYIGHGYTIVSSVGRLESLTSSKSQNTVIGNILHQEVTIWKENFYAERSNVLTL